MEKYQQQAIDLFESITIEPIANSPHYRLKMKPKKGKEKWYRCKDENEAVFYRQRLIDEKAQILKNKENYKEQSQKRLEQQLKDIEVGTILYHSRGYDQTNIDFYQVTKKKNKMIEIYAIKEEVIEKNLDYETGKKKPLKDQFTGEPMKKIITCYGISMAYGCMSKWEEGKAVSYSWGR